MTEKTMIDGVVFRAVGRKVTHAERPAQQLGQSVQLLSKQRHAVAVASSTISQQQNRARRVVTPLPHPIPPASNRIACQLACISTASQIDQRLIRRNIIDEVSLTLSQLEDWSRRPEEGIKSYSGLATYRTAFGLAAPPVDRQMFIDVGVVKEMARVVLNERDLGVVWCPPWRVRIPHGLLKEQGNELVIGVANTWHNRLCADHALPENERLTRVGHGLHEKSARNGLQPAGLLGPVRVMSSE